MNTTPMFATLAAARPMLLLAALHSQCIAQTTDQYLPYRADDAPAPLPQSVLEPPASTIDWSGIPQLDARTHGEIWGHPEQLPQPAPAAPDTGLATNAATTVAPLQPSPPSSWWDAIATGPLRNEFDAAVMIDVPTLFATTAQSSAHVQAVGQLPWISGTEIAKADAAFDPVLYSETRFDSTSDPVGNRLATGGPTRLEDDLWQFDSGVRKRTRSGGSFSLGQQLGHLSSNSLFIDPNNQGTARLGAVWNQPLLRDREIDYARSLVLTTSLETNAARAQYLDAVQEQLSAVAETYWSLYRERATFVQRQRHLQRADEIAQLLTARAALDSVRSQVLRADAAVAARRASLSQADANIRNLESQLRALVNAPGLSDRTQAELVPVQPPAVQKRDFDVQKEVVLAMSRRPTLNELQNQIQATNVRIRLACNQLQPKLNLVMEGYVAGLQGSSDVFGAWADQFSEGRPGYAGGFEFELPYRNRAAHAELRKRQLELSRLELLRREQTANIQAEVENSIRTFHATVQEVESRRQAVEAIEKEIEFLQARWQKLQGDAQLSRVQLDDLITAQDRLFLEEQSLLSAQVSHNMALIEIQRATGGLLVFSQ